MARIERVEVFMVDLVPKVKRTDAIQSFISQETPIVRIFADDGAVGTGYTYTIGTGGHAIVELLARNLAPQADRPRPRRRSRRSGRRCSSTPTPPPSARSRRSRSPRSTRRCGTCAAAAPAGRCTSRPAARRTSVPLYTTEGGWLHIDTDALVEDALARQGRRLRRLEDQGRHGRPRTTRRGSAAVRNAVGDDFEIMVDGNQGAAVDEAIRRARLYEPFDLAWYEEPLPAEDLGGHIRLSASTSLPIAVGESIYSLSHFREYLQRDAGEHRPGRRGADRRHHALAEDRAPRRSLQHGGLPAFPDGAACRADGCACRTAAGSSTSRSSTA